MYYHLQKQHVEHLSKADFSFISGFSSNYIIKPVLSFLSNIGHSRLFQLIVFLRVPCFVISYLSTT